MIALYVVSIGIAWVARPKDPAIDEGRTDDVTAPVVLMFEAARNLREQRMKAGRRR
jgi:hypothetical protein